MIDNMSKPIEAIIEDVVIDPNKIQPIIVNFQNGHLKDEEAKKMKCGLYNDEKRKKTVLAMSNGQTVYKGYRPDLTKELTYTMLAIHNKKTGKVRLVQAERWDVVPVLDEHIDKSNDDDLDRINELNKTFGSKKSKRRTEQYERMRVNIDSVKDQLEKTISNVEIEKADLEAVGNDEFIEGLHLPPCNKDATQVCDVYNMEDLVPKSILKTLYSQAVEINESEIEDKSLFFKKTLEKFKDDAKCAVKTAILLYIESIANWLNIPISKARARDLVICPHSPEVNEHVINLYSHSSVNGRLRPKTMTDKGIVHCIILGLMIWDYTLDLELFSTIFKIRLAVRKLFELARMILAVPMSDKKSVILKLPLPQPPPKVMKRKGRSKY